MSNGRRMPFNTIQIDIKDEVNANKVNRKEVENYIDIKYNNLDHRKIKYNKKIYLNFSVGNYKLKLKMQLPH